jgi:hypothetical protein
MLLAHEVSIVIDMRGLKSIRMTSSENGQELYSVGPLGLLDPDFASLHSVQIESASGVNYFIQDLRVLTSVPESR